MDPTAGYAIVEASVHIIISVWQLRFRDNKSYSEKTSCLKRMIKLDLFGGVVILFCSVFRFETLNVEQKR
jgi:hypothetical protein